MQIDYERIKNLPHCWVCKDDVSLHEHHIIPQCYGGTDGPTVTLCATCHNAVHHVSDGRVDMTPSCWTSSKEIAEKAVFLVNAIKRARIVTSTSQHKKAIVTLELNAEMTKKLSRIQAHFGNLGRVKTLIKLINDLDDRLTMR